MLLAALLTEPECRAAVMLAQRSIDLSAVCGKWPTPTDFSPPREGCAAQKPLSSNLECSLQAAADRLDFLPRPLELATEHLLLGLAAGDHEVSIWLRRRGVDPDAIEAEIRRLYGYVLPAIPIAPIAPISPINSVVGSVAEPRESTVLRILDASANRAREGLRVIEDYVRFVLDDQHLTALCKQLRHDLTEAMALISTDGRLAARETQGDVGTGLTTDGERRRGDVTAVVRANFARLQESLRSLEEFGKIESSRHTPCAAADIGWGGSCTAIPGATVQLSPQQNAADDQNAADGTRSVPATFKQLRYRVYTLERAVEITRGSIERLASARLYVLIDGRASPDEFERIAKSLIGAGVHVVQLRDKRLGDRELLDRARRLRELTRGTRTLFIMNDRPDLAALASADGVHVGQEEISVKDARRIVGPDALVGVSTHNIEQAQQAVLDGANYIGVGPTFPSETKQFERFPGLELLKAVAAEIRLPAFAIGGITRENLSEVLAAGFTRVAVSGAIASADDPGVAAKELLEMLGGTTAIAGGQRPAVEQQ